MLEICRSKDFAQDLREFDLRGMPLPYSDGFFDDMICCGVFHLIGDPEPIFKEVFRVIKPGGIFAFTILAETPEKEEEVVSHNHRVIRRSGAIGACQSSCIAVVASRNFCRTLAFSG